MSHIKKKARFYSQPFHHAWGASPVPRRPKNHGSTCSRLAASEDPPVSGGHFSKGLVFAMERASKIVERNSSARRILSDAIPLQEAVEGTCFLPSRTQNKVNKVLVKVLILHLVLRSLSKQLNNYTLNSLPGGPRGIRPEVFWRKASDVFLAKVFLVLLAPSCSTWS